MKAEYLNGIGDLETIKRKAKYGHRDWIYCHYPFSHRIGWPCDKHSIGCARLCLSWDNGRAYLVHSSGVIIKLNLATLEVMRRNAETGNL